MSDIKSNDETIEIHIRRAITEANDFGDELLVYLLEMALLQLLSPHSSTNESGGPPAQSIHN